MPVYQYHQSGVLTMSTLRPPYLIIDYDLTEDTEMFEGSMYAMWLLSFQIKTGSKSLHEGLLIQTLMEAGGENLWIHPGFIHSKQVLRRWSRSSPGPSTFDYRFPVHHYENAVWMWYRSPELIKISSRLWRDFSLYLSKSSCDTFRITWYQHLIKEIMQLFAPML